MGRSGLALLSWMALLGCEARLDPGASCTLTSECAEPLACVAGRCRSECTTARDCPRGSICLAGGGGVSACQLLPSVGDDCTGSAECGGRLVCLEGRCTDECATDDECVAGASCHPSAGCVECVTDADCPRTLRCDMGHRCAPECASDGDCAAGLVCRGDRCALPSLDGGGPVEPRAPVENDRCEDALTIPLPAPPFEIVYRASATGWTDDIPSCTPSPDGFIRFEPTGRTLVHFGCEGGFGSGLAPIESCAASAADCRLSAGQHAHYVMPDEQLFAYDSDEPEPELQFCMEGFTLGAGTIVLDASDGLLDTSFELSGAGGSACATGADVLIVVYVLRAAGIADLVADAPGVELQWEDLSIGRCFPPATGSAPLSLDTNAVAWPFRYLRLIAPGATGPVTVRISGTIPSA